MPQARKPSVSDAAAQPQVPEEEQGEVAYTVQALTERARKLFACSPHVVAGALSGERDREWTPTEAKSQIQRFLSVEHGSEQA